MLAHATCAQCGQNLSYSMTDVIVKIVLSGHVWCSCCNQTKNRELHRCFCDGRCLTSYVEKGTFKREQDELKAEMVSIDKMTKERAKLNEGSNSL